MLDKTLCYIQIMWNIGLQETDTSTSREQTCLEVNAMQSGVYMRYSPFICYIC